MENNMNKLSEFEIREIVSAFQKKCNEEDILESSFLTDKEKEDPDLVARINEVYSELRNSAPDWNRYLAVAIEQVREEWSQQS